MRVAEKSLYQELLQWNKHPDITSQKSILYMCLFFLGWYGWSVVYLQCLNQEYHDFMWPQRDWTNFLPSKGFEQEMELQPMSKFGNMRTSRLPLHIVSFQALLRAPTPFAIRRAQWRRTWSGFPPGISFFNQLKTCFSWWLCFQVQVWYWNPFRAAKCCFSSPSISSPSIKIIYCELGMRLITCPTAHACESLPRMSIATPKVAPGDDSPYGPHTPKIWP